MAEAPKLRIGTPVVAGAVRLLPVERVAVQWGCVGGRGWFTASREPWALVVRDGEGWHVLGIAGAAPTLDELRARVPGLDDALTAL